MPDSCNPNNCPLEPRVEALERANEQHSKTHREIFKRMNGVERANAIQAAQYKTITNTLGEIKATVEAVAAKPGKRWESLVNGVLGGLAVAFIWWVSAGMPGLK